MSQDPRLVNVWNTMRQRCNNPKHISYPRYGGRGIRVCDRWSRFARFYEDMGGSYVPGLTLDRIDNNGDYSLENCRWVTMSDNMRNKRNNRLFTYNDITMTMSDWCEAFGLRRGTVNQRINAYRWPIERALGLL